MILSILAIGRCQSRDPGAADGAVFARFIIAERLWPGRPRVPYPRPVRVADAVGLRGLRGIVQDAGRCGDPLVRTQLLLQFTQGENEGQPRVGPCFRFRLDEGFRAHRHRRQAQDAHPDQEHQNHDRDGCDQGKALTPDRLPARAWERPGRTHHWVFGPPI